MHIDLLVYVLGHLCLNWHDSGCTTNVYQLDAYDGARGFNPEFLQYASRVPSPCGMTVVYKNVHTIKLGKSRYRCTEWNRQ